VLAGGDGAIGYLNTLRGMTAANLHGHNGCPINPCGNRFLL